MVDMTDTGSSTVQVNANSQGISMVEHMTTKSDVDEAFEAGVKPYTPTTSGGFNNTMNWSENLKSLTHPLQIKNNPKIKSFVVNSSEKRGFHKKITFAVDHAVYVKDWKNRRAAFALGSNEIEDDANVSSGSNKDIGKCYPSMSPVIYFGCQLLSPATADPLMNAAAAAPYSEDLKESGTVYDTPHVTEPFVRASSLSDTIRVTYDLTMDVWGSGVQQEYIDDDDAQNTNPSGVTN